MKISELIKQIRLDNQLSQLDMINKMSMYDESLQDVTNVTVSRWERGVSTPPLSKVLTIIHLFNLDAFEILTTLEYKQTTMQITAFQTLVEHLYHTNTFFRLMILNLLPTKEELYICNNNNTTNDPNVIKKIKQHCSALLRQKHIADSDICIRKMKELQQNKSICLLYCKNLEQNTITAQTVFLLANLGDAGKIIERYKKQELYIDEFSPPKDNDEKLIFIPGISIHSETWVDFFFYSFFRNYINTKKIRSVYIIISQIKVISKYKALGFEIIDIIHQSVKSEIGNTEISTNTRAYILACDFNTLVTNHGYIELVKDIHPKINPSNHLYTYTP